MNSYVLPVIYLHLRITINKYFLSIISAFCQLH